MLLNVFVKIDTLTFLSHYMDFFKIDAWISPSCFVDLSKLLHGFVKVVTWIC